MNNQEQMRTQMEDIEKLRLEIDQMANYLKDAQKKVERQNETIIEYEAKDTEHADLVMRLGIQIE